MLIGLGTEQKRNFSLVTIANFFLFCNFSSFFLFPLYIKNLGGDEAAIGFIMGSFGITSLGFIPIVGGLIDRYGRKRFMLFGAAVMMVASLSNLFINEIGYLIYLPRLMQGLGFAFFFTSAATAASDFVPEERLGEGLGIFGAFTIASYAVGPTVGEFVIGHLGYNAFFIISSSFSIVTLVLVSFLTDARMERAHDPYGLDFFRVAFSRRFSGVFLTNLALAGGFGAMLNFISTYLKSKGLDVFYFFLIYSVTVMVIRVFGGRLSDAVDRRKVASPSLLFFSISIGAIAFINSLTSLVAVAFAFSLSYGLLYPVLTSIVIDEALPNERGKVMAAFNATFSLGINFLAFGFGVVAKTFGFELMYVVAGALAFMGYLIFTYLKAGERS